MNIVVASMEVRLGVDLRTAQLVKEVGDEWDWVPILPCDLVEASEVDTEFQGTMLLLGKDIPIQVDDDMWDSPL